MASGADAEMKPSFQCPRDEYIYMTDSSVNCG